MRVAVVAAFEGGSRYAHAINTVKMAQGFARLGHEVTFVCCRGRRGNGSTRALARTYGLAVPLRWVQLPCRLAGGTGGRQLRFALLALPAVLARRPQLVYARNLSLPTLTVRLGVLTVVESHAYVAGPDRSMERLVKASRHEAFRAMITISRKLAECYTSLGVPRRKLFVLPTGMDVHMFTPPRELPPSPYGGQAPVAAYVGHLYDYKGIPTILAAAALMPEVHFHLIGGWPQDVRAQQRRIEQRELRNVTLHGWKAQRELPPFLWHADVLLLPPCAGHPSAQWTSPVKLGEYLASGTPTVAAAIPALRQWLTGEHVEFVEPDNPSALAQGIRRVLCDPARASALRQAAQELARQRSYEHRAEAVLRAANLLP